MGYLFNRCLLSVSCIPGSVIGMKPVFVKIKILSSSNVNYSYEELTIGKHAINHTNSYELGENICEMRIWRRTRVEDTRESLKTQWKGNGPPNNKRASNLNRPYSKEEKQMANKHLKSCCSSLLVSSEMQIKPQSDTTAYLGTNLAVLSASAPKDVERNDTSRNEK